GIGLEFCKQLRNRDYQVTATCRKTSQALTDTATCVIPEIDLTEPAVEKDLHDRLNGKKFDLIIHNAGILRQEPEPTEANLMEQFHINAVKPILIARQLTANLAPKSNYFFITSRMGSIADNSSGG
ncbi:MAG: short-chain dehydrogenase, partial [Phototrophicales bacterium]